MNRSINFILLLLLPPPPPPPPPPLSLSLTSLFTNSRVRRRRNAGRERAWRSCCVARRACCSLQCIFCELCAHPRARRNKSSVSQDLLTTPSPTRKGAGPPPSLARCSRLSLAAVLLDTDDHVDAETGESHTGFPRRVQPPPRRGRGRRGGGRRHRVRVSAHVSSSSSSSSSSPRQRLPMMPAAKKKQPAALRLRAPLELTRQWSSIEGIAGGGESNIVHGRKGASGGVRTKARSDPAKAPRRHTESQTRATKAPAGGSCFGEDTPRRRGAKSSMRHNRAFRIEKLRR